MPINRRDLIIRAAAVGGYAAALNIMQALGITAAYASEPLPRDPTIGRGRRVIILGAGISGLVSAYELERAGFAVTVLEARQRVGGRNWTVRPGDVVRHRNGPAQTVNFDPGHYFNCGPARLPSHHAAILGYCRELGVALEVEINASRSSFAVTREGRRIRMRQLVNDTRGWISDLLAKAAKSGALDQHVTPAERAALLEFLRPYGDLDAEHNFLATARSGYAQHPGAADQLGVPISRLSLSDITDPRLFLPHMFEEFIDMQPTMFQPVGGMDQIPKAFARALDGRIRLGAEVRAIRNLPDGVEISWREEGHARTERAAFVVAALPAPILARVTSNFARDFASTLRGVRMESATKLAWQAPRFWEREDEIYGGLGYMDHEVQFLWYPSYGLHSEEGVLLGCYNFDAAAEAFGRKSLAARCASSRVAIELAHPGRGHLLKHPISIVWRDMPFNEGPWANLAPEAYVKLNQPDGRVHLAGDYLSQLVGWQEGAALSAQRTVRMISERVRAENAAAPQ